MDKEKEKKRRLEHIIYTIEQLFPPDSQYESSREKGKELLIEAICNKWRELPEIILNELMALCLYEESK